MFQKHHTSPKAQRLATQGHQWSLGKSVGSDNTRAGLIAGNADKLPGVRVACSVLWLVSYERWLRRPRHPGIPRITLRGIDDCLLSLRQQIQHNVVIILMVLECSNACNIVKHRRPAGGVNSRLENLKAVITHGRADSRERRQAPWRARRMFRLVACQL